MEGVMDVDGQYNEQQPTLPMEMATEKLIQAANDIRAICDNADGCDECPFSRQDGLYSVVCKFVDKSGHICRPSEWSLDG